MKDGSTPGDGRSPATNPSPVAEALPVIRRPFDPTDEEKRKLGRAAGEAAAAGSQGASQGGGSKDTWVLADAADTGVPAVTPTPAEFIPPAGRSAHAAGEREPGPGAAMHQQQQQQQQQQGPTAAAPSC